ncbi:MAG TPA: Crp/Fnr family transcriptional regulator [Chitinophagaceae bacterium]|jgi:CRP/FNR family transcriptional regulator
MFTQAADYLNKLSPIFEPALLAELETKTMIMEVKAGDTLINMGQTIRATPIMLKGVGKVSRINDDGQELLLYYVKEGESCALTFTCCMMAQSSVVRGSAEEDCTILAIPINLMDSWMAEYSSWKKYVMTTILNRFNEVIKTIDEVAFKKMDERLINYMKEKSKISGSSLINLTHQQIADELGTNRVVVSRLLKKLEIDKKLLLYRNQIKLLKDL